MNIHGFETPDGVEIWADTDAAIRDGLCIGSDPVACTAIAQARQELLDAIRSLDLLEIIYRREHLFPIVE